MRKMFTQQMYEGQHPFGRWVWWIFSAADGKAIAGPFQIPDELNAAIERLERQGWRLA